MKKLLIILLGFFIFSCNFSTSSENNNQDNQGTSKNLFAYSNGKNLGSVRSFDMYGLLLLSPKKYFYTISTDTSNNFIIVGYAYIFSETQSPTKSDLIFVYPHQMMNRGFSYFRLNGQNFGLCYSQGSEFLDTSKSYYYNNISSLTSNSDNSLNVELPTTATPGTSFSSYLILNTKECSPEEALGFSLPIELPIEIKDSNGNLIVTYPLSIDDSKKLKSLKLDIQN